MRVREHFKRVFLLALFLVLLTLLVTNHGSFSFMTQSSAPHNSPAVVWHTLRDTPLDASIDGEGSQRTENALNQTNKNVIAILRDSPKDTLLSHALGETRSDSQMSALNPRLEPVHNLANQRQQNPTAANRDHCKDMLDNVTHSHVTQEGKTFTSKQLDIGQFANHESLIPQILHQTWDDYNIPTTAVPFVKSMLNHNPKWQYWFWTQDDVKCYLRHKHPEYVKLYNSYYSMIFRTDVMRYFLLYDYGGIYLDLDVECLKPLDVWANLAPAVLAHETYEHAFVMHRLNVPNVMTTILATRPAHPYYKLLQDNLEKYHQAKPMDVLHSTGPYYLNDIFNLYMSTRNASRAEDDILVIHPKYWLPTYDKLNLTHICSCPLIRDGMFRKDNGEKILRNADTLLLCKLARDRHFLNVPDEQSYLDHHWVHTNLGGNIFKKPGTGKVDVRTIIPDFVPVSKRLGLDCG